MRFYEKYGPKLLASPEEDGSLNSETFTNLSYSQALIFLGIPEEERDEYIAVGFFLIFR